MICFLLKFHHISWYDYMVACFSTFQLTEVWYIYMFSANMNIDIIHNCNPELSVDNYFPLSWSQIKKLFKNYFSLFRKNFRLFFQSICTILDIFHLFYLLKKFLQYYFIISTIQPQLSLDLLPFYALNWECSSFSECPKSSLYCLCTLGDEAFN